VFIITICIRHIHTMATENILNLYPTRGKHFTKKVLVYKRSPLIGTNLHKMITEAAVVGPIFKGLYRSKHC